MSTVNSTSSGSSTTGVIKDTTSVKAQTDRFLKLLTTQLQNQNPLDPMKPQEFSSQLTQYSQLEQQMKFNEKLDTLISNSTKASVSPLSYLNTMVDFYSDTAPVQDGKAQWSYLAQGASTVNLRVEDSTGATIYTGTGDISAGTHNFSLPSTLGAGTPLKLVVTAVNAEGKTVESTVNARAKVSAVNMVDGKAVLEANGFFLSSETVTRVATIPSTTL